MPINHYFQSGRGIGNAAEKRLHEDLIVEGLKIYGQDVMYLPRTLVNKDLILGEDVTSKFDDSFNIEMYFETNTGFAGEQEIINKFGLEIRDDTTLVVAKRSFENLVANKANLIAVGRPNEGDIIFVPLMGSFFEILFVEDQEPFYQLGNLPVYKLKVTRWEYASEKLDTGLEAIDQHEDTHSLDQLNFKTKLEYGQEALTGAGSVQLENYFNTSSGQPSFLMNEGFESSNIQTQSPYADNLDLNSEAGYDTVSTADDILDFTERNPFGEVDE
tara:strand:- start:146 stop:964 length:819 start_codon:yes stop_codon:yes gene_type:complete